MHGSARSGADIGDGPRDVGGTNLSFCSLEVWG